MEQKAQQETQGNGYLVFERTTQPFTYKKKKKSFCVADNPPACASPSPKACCAKVLDKTSR